MRHPDRTSRRRFLGLSAAAMAAGACPAARGAGPLERALDTARHDLPRPRAARGNAWPGRIVLDHDPAMNGQGTIDAERVAAVVHHGVRVLTGETDTAAAFEALFPALTATTRIAIKVNCIGMTDTRWETARGVVAGLAQMLGGTYDVSQVTIYDNRDFVDRPSNPFRNSDFTFHGHTPLIVDSRSYCSAYYVYDDHRLTQFLVDCDYVINMPALKSHNRDLHELTLALKNHYGSCCPSDLCDDITGLLTLNADPHVKGKTALVLMDALRGTYDGPPQQAPQVWQTFAAGTPNLLCLSSDPVTIEYWGRELINAERLARGMEPKLPTYIEQASAAPYEIGISNEAQMTVIRHDPAAMPEGQVRSGGCFLLANRPNPFRDGTTIHYRLPAAARGRIEILDAAGRRVRSWSGHRATEGFGMLDWDGRNRWGAPLPAGVYFVRLTAAGTTDVRRMVKTR